MSENFFENKFLVAGLVLSMSLAASEAPLWISFFSFSLLVWKYLNEKWSVPKIPIKVTPILGLFIFLVVYIQFKTIFGQIESTTIFLGLIAISILNYEKERDSLFLVLLGFLVIVLKFLFSIDLIWVVPALIAFFCFWISLMDNKKINRVRYLAKSVFRSLPILIVLFIFFPRLTAFQSSQKNENKAHTGFSDKLNPGQISELNFEDKMVFRVQFKNKEMLTHDLYWRGAVLDQSDGLIWNQTQSSKKNKKTIRSKSEFVNYTIILEPSYLKNIFSLDYDPQIISS